MKILFAHQNFPAQFGTFGAYLAQAGWDVAFVSENTKLQPPPGCRLFGMKPHREPTEGVHRFARPMERAMINGQAFANAAIAARKKGLNPDIVVAHSGWGSGTFAKSVWPDCKFVSYAEWYYRWPSVDDVGMSEKTNDEDGRAAALARNAPTLLDMAEADMVLCPTHFQVAQFPDWIQPRMTVMHDGIDTGFCAPDTTAKMPLPDGALPPDAEVITYATRGMEPHRCFPDFMQAVAILQKQRPRLHVVIGGEERVAYGAQRADGKSWKEIMLAELDLDESRLHWPGPLPRKQWQEMLQATHVHVYLTVPFVLSWSMIEAMATACPLVVSDSPPVREAIGTGNTALIVENGDPKALAANIVRLLDDRALAAELGQAARARAVATYAASWIYPARARLLADLVSS